MKTLGDFKNLVIAEQIKLSDVEKDIAKFMYENFSSIKNWNRESILSGMREVLRVKKAKGNILYKIMTGFESGLPLPESLEILGQEKTLGRIKKTFN